VDFVRLGEHTFNKTKECYVDKTITKCSNPPIDIKVEKVLIHPRFNGNGDEMQLKNDIALLRLVNSVNYTGMHI
jgi:hypothetical protein